MGNAVQLQNICKTLRAGRRRIHVLRDISLEIEECESMLLVGPRGAGKTTLMKIIAGLASPTSGTCLIRGKYAGSAEARHSVGYVPQDQSFPSHFTVSGLLQFLGSLQGIQKSLVQTRIQRIVEFAGLEQWLNRRIIDIPKEIQQHVSIAQALLHEPRLLLIDESVSGWDHTGEKMLNEILLGLRCSGTTVIFAANIFTKAANLFDRFALLYEGRIEKAGNMEEVSKGRNMYRIIAERQAGTVHSTALLSYDHRIDDDIIEFIIDDKYEANVILDLLRKENHLIRSVQRYRESFPGILLEKLTR